MRRCITSFVTAVIFLLMTAAHPAQAASSAAAHPARAASSSAALKDFTAFIGLKVGDVASDAIKLYGQPEEETRSGPLSFLRYAHNSLVITYHTDTRKVAALSVHDPSGLKFISNKGVKDEKLHFIGEHVNKVITAFGMPTRISKGNHRYKFHVDNRPFMVNFVCYSRDRDTCQKIEVTWPG